MYTRLLTFTGATGIDAGVNYVREKALPILDTQHGFRGVSASADRAGKLMTILSLWETEADRSASDSALGKAREEALSLVGGSLEIENFEEVVQVITKPPMPGCVLNVVRVRMDPESIERNIAWFKEAIVPMITSQQGFCALRNMVDRQSGHALSGSAFEDKESADVSLAAIPERRSAAEERGVTFESINQREMLLSQIK
jgi:hypothetical protein